jgi:hypothetical protein
VNTAIAITAIIAAVVVVSIIANAARDIAINKHDHTPNGSKENQE